MNIAQCHVCKDFYEPKNLQVATVKEAPPERLTKAQRLEQETLQKAVEKQRRELAITTPIIHRMDPPWLFNSRVYICLGCREKLPKGARPRLVQEEVITVPGV